MELLAVAAVITLAMAFTWTNGFHDASVAIATSVSTRSLTPRVAVTLAAVMNVLGTFAGARVAAAVGEGIIVLPGDTSVGLDIVTAALIGGIAWNLLTWWRGMPSSSSHALIGGLVGAGLAAGALVQWEGLVSLVIAPMLLSPLVGFLGAALLVLLGLRLLARLECDNGNRGFRYAQTISAGAMAFGHGMQDAAKTAGVVLLALTASGLHDLDDRTIPWWVLGMCALAMGAGTYAGGWRIVRTIGTRLVALTPAQGFVAEAVSAATLYVATATGSPISTTQSIAASITGAGMARRRGSVRWRVLLRIIGVALATPPASAALAATAYLLVSPLV